LGEGGGRRSPDFYVQGSEQALAAAPENYCRVETGQGARILANGRDPNFPGWPDTLQLDYANPALQTAKMQNCWRLPSNADGLSLRHGDASPAGDLPAHLGRTPAPFWPTAIAAVRRAHPGFTFLAGAYWDLEWDLQQQGFDYLLRQAPLRSSAPFRCRRPARPSGGGARLSGSAGALPRESRRAARGGELSLAAASGSRHRHLLRAGPALLPPGPVGGARVRVPVHLRRGPVEAPDPMSLPSTTGCWRS